MLNQNRAKPLCLLLIDGLHPDLLLREEFGGIRKYIDQFPFTVLKSGDKNIDTPWNAYMELGAGSNNFDFAYKINYSIPMTLSSMGLSQLYVSDTENYANTTFFFNGKNKEQNELVQKIEINSCEKDNYEEYYEIIIKKINSCIIRSTENRDHDFILANYPIIDEKFKGDKDFLKTIDTNFKKLADIVLAYNGCIILSASTSLMRGNNIVPFLIISKSLENKSFADYDNNISIEKQIPKYWIYDIAPTILKIMGLNKPKQMIGNSLL